jgi:hypothetical protein
MKIFGIKMLVATSGLCLAALIRRRLEPATASRVSR